MLHSTNMSDAVVMWMKCVQVLGQPVLLTEGACLEERAAVVAWAMEASPTSDNVIIIRL